MGNQKGKISKFDEGSQSAFNLQEKQQLKQTCLKLLGIKGDEKNVQKLLEQAKFSQESLQKLFKNDEILGKNVYNFIDNLMPGQPVDSNLIVDACEFLCKSPVSYQFPAFNDINLESIELFICLSLGMNVMKFDKFGKIKREDVNQVLEHIFLMCDCKDEKFVTSVVEGVFENEEDKEMIKMSTFVYEIKEKMGYINRYIKQYFREKFLQRKHCLYYPKLRETSRNISDATAAFFYLGGIGNSNCDGLYRLYSSDTGGTSFNRLAYAVEGYKAPTLITLKHMEKDKDGKKTSYVFGGYNANEWEEQLKYQGSQDNFIFKLRPQQRQYFAYNGDGGSNYCYFNTKFIENSKYKVGMGFGGNNKMDRFRIWIDNEMETKTTVDPEDKAYACGFLMDMKITKLDINCIEVWGLGTVEDLERQHEYRIQKAEEQQKMRKVDKKMMFQGQVGDMLIPNLMKFKDQLREDVQRPEDFSDEDDSKLKQSGKEQGGGNILYDHCCK